MSKVISSYDALRVASYILKYFEDRKIAPTDVETLYDGGIGIAWNSVKHYVDLEIDNDTNIVFTFSKNRRNIEIVSISTVDSIADVASILDKIIEAVG